MRLIEAHSWLPRSRKKFSGYLILYASSRQMVSRLCLPAGGGVGARDGRFPRARVEAHREPPQAAEAPRGLDAGAAARWGAAERPEGQQAARGGCAALARGQAGPSTSWPASVDVVAQKEVVGLGRETTVLEEAQQVEVLAVQVPCARGAQSEVHVCRQANKLLQMLVWGRCARAEARQGRCRRGAAGGWSGRAC